MNRPIDDQPNDDANDEKLATQAKDLFDDSVERLDAATLSRLNQGRHAALEQLHRGSAAGAWGRWVPLTGVAAAALITVMLVRGPESVDLPSASVTDFEILLEGESLEMLEDLEFYSWLETTDLSANDNVG
ncbi:MAG: hypothetical protein ACR2QT_11595 [Woeseiaceae bacterium]